MAFGRHREQPKEETKPPQKVEVKKVVKVATPEKQKPEIKEPVKKVEVKEPEPTPEKVEVKKDNAIGLTGDNDDVRLFRSKIKMMRGTTVSGVLLEFIKSFNTQH